MTALTFHFHGELNDFLPPPRRDQAFESPYPGKASIKDTIESLGVPHPEIAFLLVNGAPVDFAYIVQPGDSIAVYPDSAPPHESTQRVVPPPAARFVLDVHLGRLAEYLRMLGFDTLYRNDYDDPELAGIAADEGRILLTRDLGLLKRSLVIYGRYVRHTDPQQQVVEIVQRFNLTDQIAPFSRCSRCNGLLLPVEKAAITDRLEPQTREHHDEFRMCESCSQIYWKGSHYTRIEQFIDRIRQSPS